MIKITEYFTTGSKTMLNLGNYDLVNYLISKSNMKNNTLTLSPDGENAIVFKTDKIVIYWSILLKINTNTFTVRWVYLTPELDFIGEGAIIYDTIKTVLEHLLHEINK
ncbi:UNVERIFIED_CONTAM: hypothetical protein RF648_20015 [Kocuria sp. CPCC 205274]|uniref:Uncharacterized protein n=1 Tax=Herbiconiux daphne TaxID=2970914 RepID=A0ABT2HAA9_9MICO|nr:hypothetical protein [Herbiconiux daphne]MCS5736900.1 hypothetical protein [Herbiconiux daphne]